MPKAIRPDPTRRYQPRVWRVSFVCASYRCQCTRPKGLNKHICLNALHCFAPCMSFFKPKADELPSQLFRSSSLHHLCSHFRLSSAVPPGRLFCRNTVRINVCCFRGCVHHCQVDQTSYVLADRSTLFRSLAPNTSVLADVIPYPLAGVGVSSEHCLSWVFVSEMLPRIGCLIALNSEAASVRNRILYSRIPYFFSNCPSNQMSLLM